MSLIIIFHNIHLQITQHPSFEPKAANKMDEAYIHLFLAYSCDVKNLLICNFSEIWQRPDIKRLKDAASNTKLSLPSPATVTTSESESG